MADRQLVLNDALCFLFSRYNKCDNRVIKSALLSYYNADEITRANRLFAECISKISDTEMPRRRATTDTYTVHEVDDIFAATATIDESHKLHELPIFVSDSPDKMPSTSLTEGDMRALLGRMDKMDYKMDFLQRTVNKSTAIVVAVSAKIDGAGKVHPGHQAGPFNNAGAGVAAVSFIPAANIVAAAAPSTSSQQPAGPAGSQPAARAVNKTSVLSSDAPPTVRRWEDDFTSSESVSCDDMDGAWEAAPRRKRGRRGSRPEGASNTTAPDYSLPPTATIVQLIERSSPPTHPLQLRLHLQLQLTETSRCQTIAVVTEIMTVNRRAVPTTPPSPPLHRSTDRLEVDVKSTNVAQHRCWSARNV